MKTRKNILIAFILNFCFSIFELIGGLLTNSVAIISDSIHDIGDAFSIGISYFLERKSERGPDSKYTYGYTRYSVLGALITIIILIISSFIMMVSSIIRIFNPVNINYNGMIVVAIFGVIINFLAVYFTNNGKSINEKAVNLHMIEDVLGWLVVLIGALVMKITNVSIIDSIMSILVSLFILITALKNLGDILCLFLEKVPVGISVDEIKEKMFEVDNVIDIHHIHVWSIDGYNNYATLHVVVKKDSKKIKSQIKEILHSYNINHVTIQFEDKKEICDDLVCCANENKNEHKHHHHH